MDDPQLEESYKNGIAIKSEKIGFNCDWCRREATKIPPRYEFRYTKDNNENLIKRCGKVYYFCGVWCLEVCTQTTIEEYDPENYSGRIPHFNT